MLRSIRLPIVFLFAFPILINLSFSSKDLSTADKLRKHIGGENDSSISNLPVAEEVKDECTDLYTLMKLDEKGLSKNAFDLALKGYNNLVKKRMVRNKDIITVIDFSKPSNEKRLFVIDLKKDTVLFQSLVAHGRNSGFEYAKDFSNEMDSHKSSLGFYITMKTYTGEHGYSLKLKGCERGFNNKAYDRAIVIHGSEYVTEKFLKSAGYLGRSFGCPALPEKINKKIINVIKNGSCLFLYHPTRKYLLTSPVLNG
jgi:L,D-transpeptidase catalytic domain